MSIIRFSDKKEALMAVAGHAGSGHCHSHNQYVQDDSGGLATVLALFQEAAPLSLVIKEVRTVTGISGSITVETVSGGIGSCSPRRGITPQEARLAKSLEGRSAIRTQALAMEAFGRVYGQGVHETAVALQTAVANAAVDGFIRNFPDRFMHAEENLVNSCGKIAGAILEYQNVPVAVLATVNAAADGSGPVEDLEGNVLAGSKKAVMRALGMHALPTVVVEGKVYSPAFSDAAAEPFFLVRSDPDTDNPAVGKAIVRASEKLGYATRFREDVMRRVPGALEKTTRALADAVIAAGEDLKNARMAQEKVAALATLARLVSEDGAGVSFMSDRLHEIVGGTGLLPGTGAVLSRVMPKSYRDAYVFPFLTESDIAMYVALVKAAVLEINAVLPEALALLKDRLCREDLDRFVMV